MKSAPSPPATSIFQTKDGRGKGLRTNTLIKKGEFVITYKGENISQKEMEDREVLYEEKGYVNDYIFCFQHKSTGRVWHYIDARFTKCKAKYINHSKKHKNIKAVVEVEEDDIKLNFYAVRDIYPKEELLFDYGEDRKDILKEYTWLKE